MCMNTITLAVETCFSLKTWLLWAESLHGAGRNTTERFSMHERVDCLHLMDLQPAEGNSPVGGTVGVGQGEDKESTHIDCERWDGTEDISQCIRGAVHEG